MALLNRLLGVLLGLVVAAAGVLLIVETVAAAMNRTPVLVDREVVDSTLSQLSWTDPLLLWVSIGLIVVGALLLLLQLIPRQPATLPLRGYEGRSAEIDRKALGGRLAAIARRDPDVAGAKGKMTKRAAKLSVRAVPGADLTALRDRLVATVTDALASFDLATSAKPKVSVSPGLTRAPRR
jgi:hypothetical protein